MTERLGIDHFQRRRPLLRLRVAGRQRRIRLEQQALGAGDDGHVDQQPHLLAGNDRGRRPAGIEHPQLFAQRGGELRLHRGPHRRARPGRQRTVAEPRAVVGQLQAGAGGPAAQQQQVEVAAVLFQVALRLAHQRPGAVAAQAAMFSAARRVASSCSVKSSRPRSHTSTRL